MDNRMNGVAGIGPELRRAGETLLSSARKIVEKQGENRDSMNEIGKLLRTMSESGALSELIATRPGEGNASVDLIAEYPDGSNLSFYAMDGWVTQPKNAVHWHNYWQSLLVVRGIWRDTVWKPVRRVSKYAAEDIEVDRREVLPAGEIQVLGRNEPHGWEAEERRRADEVCLLMWSASACGQPRVDLDIVTGALSEEYGFLNSMPDRAANATLGRTAS